MKKILLIMFLIFILIISSINISSFEINKKAELVLDFPDSVLELETFPVRVTDNKNATVENATVTVQWDNNKYYTNTDGFVYINAPEVDEKQFFWVNATHNNYKPAEKNVEITNIYFPQLIVISSSEIDENNEFIVVITRESLEGKRITNATVTFQNRTYPTASNGAVYLTAPEVDVDTEYVIYVEKTGYLDANKTITVKNKEIIQPALEIDASIQINENDTFIVTIFSEENIIQYVRVVFNDIIQYTNNLGQVTFNTPFVDSDTIFEITATKTGYKKASADIKIINTEEEFDEDEDQSELIVESEYGWFYGFTSYNEYGISKPVEGVQICVTILTEDNIVTNKCTLTDKDGYYYIKLEEGEYIVKAEKEGYESIIKNNELIIPGVQRELDFSMVKKEDNIKDSSFSNENEELINTALLLGKQNNKIGAEIKINDGLEKNIYRDLKIDYSENKKEKGFTIVVSDEKDHSPTIMAIETDEIDVSKIQVTYDGENVKLGSLKDLFSLNSEKPLYWVLETQKENGGWILFFIPGFSEHTITVTSIAQQVVNTLKGPLGIALYVTFIVMTSIIFISFGLSGSVIRFLLKRNK